MRTKRLKPFAFNAVQATIQTQKPAAPAERLLAFAQEQGLAAEDVTLFEIPFLPASPAVPVDGRLPLEFDQAKVIADYNAKAAKGRMAPVDVGHRLLFDAATPAVGWIAYLSQASWDPAQTSAWVLGTQAYEMVSGKTMGYTSPVVYGYDSAERGVTVVTGVHSHTLTNTPALEMPMNFSEGAEATDLEPEAPADEQATEPAPAAVEGAEAASAALGSSETEKAAQTPAEAQPAASAAETTALSATSTAPTAQAAPSADLVALTASVTALTAERDAAAAQFLALSAQLTALTTERDTAVQALATFKAEQTKAEVERVIAEFTAAGKCTPAEHEDLREYAASLGVDKLNASLSKRVPSAAFTRLSLPAASTDEGPSVPPDVAEYLSQIGGDRLVAAYKRGVSGQ